MAFRLFLSTVLVILIHCAVVFPQAAQIESDLADRLARSDPTEFIHIAFIMRRQLASADFQRDHAGLPISEQRLELIRDLRGIARSSQADMLRDMRDLARLGYARDIRSLWISNAVAAQIRADQVLPLLQRHAEIARAHWDPPRDFGQMHDASRPLPPDNSDQISWGVQDINAPQVWSLGYRGQGVVIGNIDSGVNYNHPDLAQHIWVNPGEDLNGNGLVDSTDWNGVDDDGNGYIDDLRGWAFDADSSDVMDQDPSGHGTATSGIVVGDGTNGNATGVAPEAKMMVLKNYAAGESAYWEAQQYAMAMGATVITSSLSYKWYYIPRPDYATMRHNTEMELEAGIVHANSIGNQGSQQELCPIPFNIATPGNCPPPWLHPDQTLIGGVASVMGVGAYLPSYQLATYSGVGPAAWYLRDILALDSNYSYQATWPPEYNDYPYQGGLYMALLKPDVAAPTNVMTTSLGGGYIGAFSGTSAATPHLGGTFCLLRSAVPDATPETLARVVMTTATDMGAVGKDNYWGTGRLDAYAALVELLSEVSATLTGAVTDSNTGLAIEAAEVDLPELEMWTQTDTAGEYLLVGIPAGSFDVRFVADGYDTLVVPQVAFSIGATVTLDAALTGPHIQVEPESISVALVQGDSLQIPILVQNTGSSDLMISFLKQGDWIPYWVFQVIQAQELAGDSKLFGTEVAWDRIWITGGNNNLEPNLLYGFAFDGELVDTLFQPESSSTWGWYDLAWDGQYLYGSSGNVIEGIDEQSIVRETIIGPLALHRALAYDPATDHFFSADNTSDIYEFDRAGFVFGVWSHNLHIQGLAWHALDQDGYPLYIFSQDGTGALLRLTKMNPATGDTLYVTTLVGGPTEQAGGAAISGELDPARWCFIALVQGGPGGQDRVQIHSLNAYAPWLSVEPQAQVIPPGGSLDANALFDASTVSAGVYNINLVVQNNAGGGNPVIPTAMVVQPVAVQNPSGAALPQDFDLDPAYPNPFNAAVKLSFRLPLASHVKMEIYNLQGRKVQTLLDELRSAGSQSIVWDTHRRQVALASGIYLLKMDAQSLSGRQHFSACRKLLLVR